jgi:hypothetical protein
MRKQSTKREALPTIWQVPDELWGRIVPILAELDPPKPTGRKRINARAAFVSLPFNQQQKNGIQKKSAKDTRPSVFT